MSEFDTDAAPRTRELTGRVVLICFAGFFVVVTAVNAAMIYAATSTFGGVETENAYKAGLAFNNELAAARAQDMRRWKVTGAVRQDRRGEAMVEIAVVDEAGRAPEDLKVSMRLMHPTDRRLDHVMKISDAKGGRFRGVADINAGLWDLEIDIRQSEQRVFRSKSRIVIQ